MISFTQREIIEKSQTEIMELRNTMNKMKNAIESIKNRLDQTKESV